MKRETCLPIPGQVLTQTSLKVGMAGARDQGYMELVLMTTPSNTSSFGNGNGDGSDARSERLRSSLAQCSLFTGLPPAGVDDLIRRMTQRSSSARSAVVS